MNKLPQRLDFEARNGSPCCGNCWHACLNTTSHADTCEKTGLTFPDSAKSRIIDDPTQECCEHHEFLVPLILNWTPYFHKDQNFSEQLADVPPETADFVDYLLQEKPKVGDCIQRLYTGFLTSNDFRNSAGDLRQMTYAVCNGDCAGTSGGSRYTCPDGLRAGKCVDSRLSLVGAALWPQQYLALVPELQKKYNVWAEFIRPGRIG